MPRAVRWGRTSSGLGSVPFEPAPSRLAKPVANLMMQAGINLLPDWAGELLERTPHPLKRRLVGLGIDSTAPVLRWAMRDSSLHRARRRVGCA